MTARRIPRYGGEILLAAGSVALVAGLLLAAEAVARRLDPEYLSGRPEAGLARLHRYSEAYGWEPVPNAVTSIDGQRTTINARGQRGRAHPLARTARPRLVVLGDSIAFGHGVTDEATFSARLEERGYEVVNLAVDGYGTDQSLLRLEKEGIAYRADAVLLHFCLANDFVDNVSRTFFYDGLHPKPYFTLEEGVLRAHLHHLRLSPRRRAELFLRERSHLFNRMVARPVPTGNEWMERRDAVLGDPQAARALTARLVARVAEVGALAGARLVLVLHPDRTSFREVDSPWLAALRATPAGVVRVDTGERFRAKGMRFSEVMLDSLGHLNPRGHAELAALLDEVLRTFALPRPAAAATVTASPPRGRREGRTTL
ncbi:MAG TPA: SGNH/GDSL hydrolase family protein [Vicinamibacteria bacterium]|nr:SGNH/GDSL hydrolase family protein [Vicinamibacteria bacterium]